MPLRYTLEEYRLDDLGLTREYFIDTPCGRMSVRMPEFISMREQRVRLTAILAALNSIK